MAETIKTTCPYCGVGCGVLATVEASGAVSVSGDPEHPANRGRLCSKGTALAETLGLEGRLLTPKIGGKPVSWDRATGEVARRFESAIQEHGPDSVAFYVSGQLLSEDYYVANKLMKGFIGSANIDTNSRLCMSSSVAGHMRAFGSDTVPGCYEDFDLADLVVLVGSNMAWCHPVLFRRLREAKERHHTKIVVIDPRRTETCSIADLHLPIKSGADVALFNGLLAKIAEANRLDHDYLRAHTKGFEAALASAKEDTPNLQSVARKCGLTSAEVKEFYDLFLATAKTLTVYSQGVNQSTQGTDKVNAIINCHLATGRIGKPGASPFSITGQPNAMGGREVGGLATTLAAHMGFSDQEKDRVKRFWNSPAIASGPGLKAVDLFENIHAGKVKAVWIMATNPAVSLPNSNRVREALRRCEFVAVSDCMENTDTTKFADVVLPATTWGERNGTVTNSERRISRQKPFITPPGESKHDWQIICDVAEKMGHGEAFSYQHPSQIFGEFAQLTALENNGSRDLDLSAFDMGQFESHAPIQWPNGKQRLFAEGNYFTADRRASFVPVTQDEVKVRDSHRFPFHLNSGRVRDHWHSMTRTAKSPRLAKHRGEPYVSIHPNDAKEYGLEEGGWARVSSAQGEVTLKVHVSDEVTPGDLFIPIHWNGQVASNAVVSALYGSRVDTHSGQPDSKKAQVSIAPWRPAWRGFLITTAPKSFTGVDYWCRIATEGGFLYELSGAEEPQDWEVFSTQLWGTDGGERLTVSDRSRGIYRCAEVREGRLKNLLVVSRKGDHPSPEWVLELFDGGTIAAEDRASVLAARPSGGIEDAGPTICSCFNVGLNTIIKTIAANRVTEVSEISRLLSAGTNCGSCLSELGDILARELNSTARVA